VKYRSTRAQLGRRLSPHNWICRISRLPAGRSLVRCKQRLRRNGECWVSCLDPTYATGGSGDYNAPCSATLWTISVSDEGVERYLPELSQPGSLWSVCSGLRKALLLYRGIELQGRGR
jgi:hypothetical protein